MVKVTEIGKIKHNSKKRGQEKPSSSDRKKLKALRRFKKNNN